MSTRTSPWPPGTPCWTDLTVPDRAAARAFYAAVLGWEFVETGEDFGGYVIAHVGDSPAAGIGPQQPGVSPAWTLYIASADADATAAAVVEHGGTVVLEPGDVGPLGRMLLAADASGAVFGVWQASSHIGAGVVNEAGGRTWEDLRSTDPDAARSFYSNVFGYHHEPLPEAPPDYLTFAASPGEPPLGGIGGMMGADGAPSHWLVYFAVGDADASVAAAVAHGGSVLAPAFDTPFGRMAGLTDPPARRSSSRRPAAPATPTAAAEAPRPGFPRGPSAPMMGLPRGSGTAPARREEAHRPCKSSCTTSARAARTTRTFSAARGPTSPR